MPVVLRKWQQRDIRKIYDSPHGTRTAIISFAKKNAKTSLASFLLLLHLCGPEAKPNTQLRSTAQSKDQAAVLFNLAAKVVRLSPTLSAHVQLRDTAEELLCPELGTHYKALSAEVSTAHVHGRASAGRRQLLSQAPAARYSRRGPPCESPDHPVD